MGWRGQTIRFRRYLFAAIGLAVMLAAACSGGGGSEGVPGDGGPDFAVEGIDPSGLCPAATILSKNLTVSAQSVADNTLAAKSASDPEGRERQYDSWGRLTGHFAQWAFRLPSGLTQEQIRQETLANPFLSASCSAELYKDGEGAHNAFATLAAEARNPPADPSSGLKPTVNERSGSTIGDESVDLVYPYPTFNVLVISFRMRNVIGTVSVIASGKTDDYAEVMATAMVERLGQTLQPAA